MIYGLSIWSMLPRKYVCVSWLMGFALHEYMCAQVFAFIACALCINYNGTPKKQSYALLSLLFTRIVYSCDFVSQNFSLTLSRARSWFVAHFNKSEMNISFTAKYSPITSQLPTKHTKFRSQGEKHQTQIQVDRRKWERKKIMMIYEIPFHTNAQHKHTIHFTNEL